MGTLTKRDIEVVQWVIIVLGLIVTMLAFFSFALKLLQYLRGKSRSQHGVLNLLLKGMVIIPPLSKTLVLLINILAYPLSKSMLLTPWKQQHWLAIFAAGFSGYALMATYLLLVFYWVWLYRQARERNHRLLFLILDCWKIGVAVVVIIWVVLLMLMAALPGSIESLHTAEEVYSGLLSIVVAVMFASFAWLLRLRFAQIPINSKLLTRLGIRIMLLSSVCTILFLFRTFLQFMAYWVWTTGLPFLLCQFGWIVVGNFLPSLIMILTLSYSFISKMLLTPRPGRRFDPESIKISGKSSGSSYTTTSIITSISYGTSGTDDDDILVISSDEE